MGKIQTVDDCEPKRWPLGESPKAKSLALSRAKRKLLRELHGSHFSAVCESDIPRVKAMLFAQDEVAFGRRWMRRNRHLSYEGRAFMRSALRKVCWIMRRTLDQAYESLYGCEEPDNVE